MNIQRDVNSERDKKLDKMLDAKFGKQSKTIVKGETVRVAQALLKRVIKARKQFEDTVFNKPQGQKVSKRRVGKHGTHDQSTHAPKAGGARSLHEAASKLYTKDLNRLSEMSRGSKKYKSTVQRMAREYHRSPEKIEAVINRRQERQDRMTADNPNWQERRRRGPYSRKVTKRGIDKHGTHDQRTHSPTGRAAVARERAKPQGKPEGPSSPAPLKVKLRVKLQSTIEDVDTILDGIDTGTRLYSELKEARDAIREHLKERRERNKVTKIDKIQQAIEKGIGHSLEILTNAIRLIGVQEPDAELSEADEKKLQTIIDEILGVAGYLDTVKEQGYFEKIQKHPGDHDQQVHDPTGGGGAKPSSLESGSTYDTRKPSGTNPFRRKPDWELRNMRRALTSMPLMNDKEENTRLADVEEELKSRRKRKKVSKGEASVPDSSASYRPSFTTPAVAREQKRQRTEPNAKGRGESTARAAGY